MSGTYSNVYTIYVILINFMIMTISGRGLNGKCSEVIQIIIKNLFLFNFIILLYILELSVSSSSKCSE